MKHRSFAFLIILCISFLGCQNKQEQKESNKDGVWESVGYGRIVKIEQGEYVLADVTKYSCLPVMSGEISEFGEAIQMINDTLSLKDGINIYYFTRIEEAPLICKKNSNEKQAADANVRDPEHNFEVLWDTFKTHYAYFELRKVNPDSLYVAYRSRVSSETSEAELFFVLNEMLTSFGDGHIYIEADDEIEEAANKLNKTKSDGENANANSNEPLRKHEVAKAVAEKYIPEGKSIKNGNLRWGILENNVGYFQVNQMMGMANYGISDTLSYRDYWMAYFDKLENVVNDNEDELDGLNASLDVIMNDLANTEALIIDVRFNGGGKDEVGMDVLKRLNKKEQVVFTKKARLGNGYTPTINVVQPAIELPYSNPVFLLISVESASATEIMALSSLSMPNITRIGSDTEGVFSDVLDKALPNGWEFGLSNEVYLDMEGVNYEGIGIPPNIPINYQREPQAFLQQVIEELKTEDSAISKALDLISN